MFKLPPKIDEFQRLKGFPSSRFTTDGSLFADVSNLMVTLYQAASQATGKKLDNLLKGVVKNEIFSKYMDHII